MQGYEELKIRVEFLENEIENLKRNQEEIEEEMKLGYNHLNEIIAFGGERYY